MPVQNLAKIYCNFRRYLLVAAHLKIQLICIGALSRIIKLWPHKFTQVKVIETGNLHLSPEIQQLKSIHVAVRRVPRQFGCPLETAVEFNLFAAAVQYTRYESFNTIVANLHAMYYDYVVIFFLYVRISCLSLYLFPLSILICLRHRKVDCPAIAQAPMNITNGQFLNCQRLLTATLVTNPGIRTNGICS